MVHCNNYLAPHHFSLLWPFCGLFRWFAGVVGDAAGHLAQVAALIGGDLQLLLDELLLKDGHFLDRARLDKSLGEIEGRSDVVLDERQGLARDVRSANANRLGRPLGGNHGLLGGIEELLEGLARFADALLGGIAHLFRDVEAGRLHDHSLFPHVGFTAHDATLTERVGETLAAGPARD